jgi:nitric oxide reductase large subunit
MSANYKAIKSVMNLTDENIERVLALFDKLYDEKNGVHPIVVYNTIEVSDLTDKEKQFAIFMWGVNVGIASYNPDDEEEEGEENGY